MKNPSTETTGGLQHKAAANPEVFCYVVGDAIHLGLPHVQWAPLPTLFAPSQAT